MTPGGRERARPEWEELFTKAGFEIARIIPLKASVKLDRGAYARLKVTRLAASLQGMTVPLCRSVVSLPHQRIYEVIAHRNLTTVGDLWKSSEHRDGHKLSSTLCRSYRVLENTPFPLQLICKIQRSGGVSPL